MSVLSQPVDLSYTRKCLESTDTYATVLFAIYFDEFGDEDVEDEDELAQGEDGKKERYAACLTWAPETIRRSIYDAFQVQLPQANLDKLMAAIMLITTDQFYRHGRTFIQLCNILSGDTFDPSVFDPATTFECAWGITEAMLLAPPKPENGEPFSDDIRRYIGVVCDNEGILDPPDILGLALYDQPKPKLSVETFGGDAEMFQTFYQSQLDFSNELRESLVKNTRELLTQLSGLKLKTGSTDYAAQLLGRVPDPRQDA